ncbi:hypothetical protein HDZ31DRAFT_80291 [Schizophyllum fasciatum]
MIARRDAICARIGAVPELPIDDFIRHFLPSQRLLPTDTDSVIKMLKEKWRKHAYFPNSSFAEKLERAQAWRTSNGNRALPSQKTNTAMPDDGVHQITVDNGGDFDWDSSVVVEEYKTMKDCAQRGTDSEVASQEADFEVPEPSRSATQLHIDNSKKVIWSMHHILRTDPRRRFTFGITFANTDVRLWHHSRAAIVVSASFDFNKSARTLIDIYSRFAFASLEELGYDLTMKLLHDHPALDPKEQPSDQYRIHASGVNYITTGVLSNQAAENGFGRCTRVFRAYKEEDAAKNPKTFYAIKDSWLEKGRRTEFAIYQDIINAVGGHDWKASHEPAPALRRLISYTSQKPADPFYDLSAEERKLFFIPIIAGGKVHAGGVIDDTHTVIGRGYDFPLDGRKVYSVWDTAVLTAKQGSVLTGVIGNDHLTGHPKQTSGIFLRAIPAREHHRIVMEEGQKLLDDMDIKSVFSTVKDAAYALFILHSVGFLYRDISAGNILRHAGRGVLADLEYVRSVGELQSHNMRTGTADFAAVEVVRGDFLVAPALQPGGYHFPDPEDLEDELAPIPSVDTSVWRYRDAHDLESIYWLVLWILLRHNTSRTVPSSYDPIKKMNRYNEIFPHSAFSTDPGREDVLRNDRVLCAALKLLPTEWQRMANPIRELRNELMAIYEHNEKGKPLPPTMWALVNFIPGSFTPPIIDDGLNRIYRRAQRASKTVRSRGGGTQESAGSSGSKRTRQDMQSAGTSDAAKQSSAPVQPLPKKKKSAPNDAVAQPPRRSTRLNPAGQ